MRIADMVTVKQAQAMNFPLRITQEMARQDWLDFETDKALEEGNKIPRIAAKRQTWNTDFLSYCITIDGELSEIEIGFSKIDEYNLEAVTLHHLEDYE